MKKDNIDIEFETIDRQKEITFKLEKENEELFSSYLSQNDNSVLDKIISNLLRDDYYKTGELKRMGSIVSILTKEIAEGVEHSFAEGLTSYEELYEKYVTVILLLRRIEMAAEEEFSAISYETLPSMGINAIIEVIKSEYFERRLYILSNLYSKSKLILPDDMKLEWLTKLIEAYPADNWYIEMASLYLDYGQMENALIFLEKIEKPSEEIKELVEELKNVGGTK